MANRSFKQYVEEELGQVPKFFIYALLEWTMIFVLFIDGFIAFFANEFSRFFDLPIPCLHCTRIDHVIVRRNPDFYYNESICNHHQKKISNLAFCHAHQKLSDIRTLCESCLLSFATEKESDCDTYKSLLGILHKDIELFVDDDQDVHLSLPSGRKDVEEVLEKSSDKRCSCCGEPLKVKSSASSSYYSSKGKNPSMISALAPAPSPRSPAIQNLHLSHVKYPSFKLNHDHESEVHDDNDRSRGITREKSFKMEGEDEDKTPSFIKGNRFFGISLSDSATNSPRWTRVPKKSPLEKTEFASESAGDPHQGQQPHPNDAAEVDILHNLKRQVRMDRKSLMALYMELDEERNASAVAAYNAMAMITRLQAEKAAVQMEALQYQRMMEEQAEYDQEALQEMNNLLTKRDEELKDLENELEAYRQNYGCLKDGEDDYEEGQLGGDQESEEGYRVMKPPSRTSSNGGPESTSPAARSLKEDNQPTNNNNGEKAEINHDQIQSGSKPIEKAVGKSKNFSRQLGRLTIMDKKPQISSDSEYSSENEEYFMEEEEETGDDQQGRS